MSASQIASTLTGKHLATCSYFPLLLFSVEYYLNSPDVLLFFSPIPTPTHRQRLIWQKGKTRSWSVCHFFVSLESVKRQFKLYVCVAVCELTPHRLGVMVGTPVAALTLKL